MADTISVETRDPAAMGSRASRKIRQGGRLPAVLYGGGGEPEHLTLDEADLRAVIRHGGHVVKLTGGATGQALLQDVQWDTFSTYLMHADLLRVSKGEKVEVDVRIKLKGESPGDVAGGIVVQPLNTVAVRAAVGSVPEELLLDISGLEMGGSLLASDISLPEGIELVTDAEETVITCNEPQATEEEPTEGVGGAAEPEVIGAKSEDEEEDS